MDSNKDFESSFGIILDELDCQRFALIKYKKNPNKFNEIDVWATKGWIENEKIVVDKEKIKSELNLKFLSDNIVGVFKKKRL